MKIICECGAVVELIDGEDGSSYTEGEGWYKVRSSYHDIDISASHDALFLQCRHCGKEEWIFT